METVHPARLVTVRELPDGKWGGFECDASGHATVPEHAVAAWLPDGEPTLEWVATYAHDPQCPACRRAECVQWLCWYRHNRTLFVVHDHRGVN